MIDIKVIERPLQELMKPIQLKLTDEGYCIEIRSWLNDKIIVSRLSKVESINMQPIYLLSRLLNELADIKKRLYDLQ